MVLTKDITLDYVGVRYLKLFKYVNLRNDGDNKLFMDIMKCYEYLYDDNKSGITYFN